MPSPGFLPGEGYFPELNIYIELARKEDLILFRSQLINIPV